ncbi:MAG: hypothetical protein CMG58_06725 [Candidatus Marinimicrobia bacterium]|nr:hypothetical protein [Candidatus Neomarinimicrobiota bacterium]
MFGVLAQIIEKYLRRYLKTSEPKERKKEILQVFLWSGVGIVSIITYVPRGTSITQIIIAIGSFFIILYLAIRALKYFKIL